MKCFKVKEGTVGSVYYPKPDNRRKHNFRVRKELVFAHEEMIFDPVAYANKKLKVSRWCLSQARKGLAGFRRDGFLLVVKYADVEVM